MFSELFSKVKRLTESVKTYTPRHANTEASQEGHFCLLALRPPYEANRRSIRTTRVCRGTNVHRARCSHRVPNRQSQGNTKPERMDESISCERSAHVLVNSGPFLAIGGVLTAP